MELISFDPKNFFLAILLFIGGCMSFESSEPVIVRPPISESHVKPGFNAFTIELREDNTVWYSIVNDAKQSPQKVDEPIRKNLGKQIAGYKKQSNDLPTSFFVKGHPVSQYSTFEQVIDALKDNDEFKYQLVTAETEEQEMQLNLPEAKDDDPNKAGYDKIETKLTLLLLNTASVYGYTGNNIKNGNIYDYKNVRNIIKEKSKKYGNKFVVIIKPGKDATYKNTVDILDEMTINKIKKFVMLEMNAQEKTFIINMNTKS